MNKIPGLFVFFENLNFANNEIRSNLFTLNIFLLKVATAHSAHCLGLEVELLF